MAVIDTEQGGYAGYHNYYVPEEFFARARSEGSIYLRDGQRAALVSEAFINALHNGTEQEAGQASGLMMYYAGYQWGVEDMKRFGDRMRQEFGGGKLDMWQMNRKFVFETWWWPLTVQGFGGWKLDLKFKDKGIIIVEIKNSAVAQSVELTNKPVCHLYAGMFAGVMSVYEREEREAIEIQCYAMGHDRCKFLIGENKQVNAADFWLKEGATANEIVGNFE